MALYYFFVVYYSIKNHFCTYYIFKSFQYLLHKSPNNLIIEDNFHIIYIFKIFEKGIDFLFDMIYYIKRKYCSTESRCCMSAKIGRPLSDNPMGNRIGVRLDNNTLKTLDECCKELKQSKSDVIRIGINLVAEKLSKSE